MRYIKIKNTDTSSHVWGGIEFSASEEVFLENESDLSLFIKDNGFFCAIGDGKATVNNGTIVYQTAESAWNFLIGHSVENIDNRQIVHATPRFLGTYTVFTGSDDDHTDPHSVGGSSNINDLFKKHEVGGPNPEQLYLEFNTIYNKTYVRQGDIMWKDADFDFISFHIVPKITTYSSGSNTNYNLYGGYLIVPAAGDGTTVVSDEDRVLVECTPNEFGVYPAGYWDADWNITTKELENITPNYGGAGKYNMFGAEVSLNCFVNRRRLLGSNTHKCATEDISQLGHNLRLRLDMHTYGTDHAWSFGGTMMLYRQKTV